MFLCKFSSAAQVCLERRRNRRSFSRFCNVWWGPAIAHKIYLLYAVSESSLCQSSVILRRFFNTSDYFCSSDATLYRAL